MPASQSQLARYYGLVVFAVYRPSGDYLYLLVRARLGQKASTYLEPIRGSLTIGGGRRMVRTYHGIGTSSAFIPRRRCHLHQQARQPNHHPQLARCYPRCIREEERELLQPPHQNHDAAVSPQFDMILWPLF